MEKFEEYLKQSDDYFQTVDNYLATDIEKFLIKVKEVINNSEPNHNNNE